MMTRRKLWNSAALFIGLVKKSAMLSFVRTKGTVPNIWTHKSHPTEGVGGGRRGSEGVGGGRRRELPKFARAGRPGAGPDAVARKKSDGLSGGGIGSDGLRRRSERSFISISFAI